MLAAVLLMGAAAQSQPQMTREFVGAFKVDSMWFHPTSDSTVELVPCQGECTPPGRFATVPARVSHEGQTYTVTRIGRRALRDIITTVLPETVLDLGDDCMWASRVDSVRLPSSLRRIGSNSIAGTYPNLYIPAAVEHIDANAFEKARVSRFTVDEGNRHYCSVDGFLYSADTTELVAVPYNYRGEDGALVLPSTVRRIGAYAMRSVNSQLTTLTLPEGLEEIGLCGLGSYRWEVELPASVKRIEGCPVSLRPTVPFSLTVNPANPHYRVEDGQLMSMDGDTLLLVQLPAVQNTYTVPEGVKVLGDCLFCEWERQLDSITLPEGLEVIGAFAFSDIWSKVNIPSTLKSIKYGAFALSKLGGDLVLPQGVRELEPYAFSACKITSVVLPDSLEVVPKAAFVQCSLLRSVTFGNRLREIHSEAFMSCNLLTSLPPLPATVRMVGYDALSSRVSYLEFEGAPEAIGSIAIRGATAVRFGEGNPPRLYPDAMPSLDTVYLPCGMAEVYRGAALLGWGDRYHYVEDCDGIGEAEASDGLTVAVRGLALQVAAADGAPVRVLDALGRTLYYGPAATLRLPAAGIYLVHTPSHKARKVVALP